MSVSRLANSHIYNQACQEGYYLNIFYKKAMDKVAACSQPARKMFKECNSGHAEWAGFTIRS